MNKGSSSEVLQSHYWLTLTDGIVGLFICSLLINTLGLVFPITLLQVYDRVIPNNSYDTMFALGVLVVAALLTESILKIFRAYVSAWSTARFTYNIGCSAYKRILYGELNYIEKESPGILLEQYNAIEDIKEYYCGNNLIMMVDVPFVLVYLAVMYIINQYLVLVPIFNLCAMLLCSVKSHTILQQKLATLTNLAETKLKFLIEMISGIHTVKALGIEAQMLRRFERLYNREITENYQVIQLNSRTSELANLFSQLTVVLTVSLGAYLVFTQRLSVGGLAASILLSGKIMQPVAKMVNYWHRIKKLEIAKEDVAKVFSIPSEQHADSYVFPHINGKIELRDVSFAYPDSETCIFNNINLTIERQEIVAIHGDGQIGKSTLLALMGGILHPTSGDVYIDDHNLKTVDLDALRNQIGYLPQTAELFTGTILENLTLFENDVYFKQAKEMSILLGLDAVIQSMPSGYQTKVGTGTVDIISAGHKQQILLTRSLLTKPNIILFDEANTALDIDSDNVLRTYFEMLIGHRTIVLVTRRPSWLALADKHYKLEHGNISEIKWNLPN